MTDGKTAAAKRRRAKADAAPTTPDPLEIAMEAAASGVEPVGVAHRLLAKQERLIGWQIARERAGAVLTGLAAIAAAAALVGLALMTWRASQADGVVVRAFTAPTALEQAGMGGEVLAARFLDRINAHQLASRGTALQSTTGFSGSEGDALSLEIPNTGVSVADAEAFLRRWLGHETAITGNISLGADGSVRVTARYGAQPAVQVEGPAGEIDSLIQRAADAIYRQADPLRAIFVQPSTPEGEAARDALFARLRSEGSLQSRAGGFSFSGARHPDAAQALRYAQVAAAMQPNSPMAHAEIGNSSLALGRDERALLGYRQARRAMDDARHLRWSPGSYEGQKLQQEAMIARLSGDFATAANKDLRRQENLAMRGSPPRATYVRYLAAGHDTAGAARELDKLALQGPREVNWWIASGETLATGDRPAEAAAAFLKAVQALDNGDAAARAEGRSQSLLSRSLRLRLTASHALALAQAGDVAGAQAMIGPTARDCYPCLRARGSIAALARDPSADGWFAEALRQAPSLPFAEVEWAEVRLVRGDATGAAPLAAAARRKAPRFADPLEVWGEALLATADAKAAATKFAQAAEFAPRWGRLHLKWGEALAAQGKTDEARARWRVAAAMDLTAAERANLQTLLQKRTN